MEFNIKDHISKLKKKVSYRKNESKIENIISKHIDFDILGQVEIKKDIICFPRLHSAVVVKIKNNKHVIISLLKEEGIYIRDII